MAARYRGLTSILLQPPTPRRLLLVGTAPSWQVAVEDIARLRHAVLDIVSTPLEALAWMLRPDRVDTQMLAVAPLDTNSLDSLMAMLDESANPDAGLILLGQHGNTNLPCVPHPDPTLLAKALDAAGATPRRPAAMLNQRDIAASLYGGRLRMRFQPIVRARDLEPIGIEALARLHDAARGILHPRDFIDPIVEAGLERVLTSIVAARSMIELQAVGGLQDIFLSLNMPLPTLLHPNARKRAMELCAVAGILPARIMLEAIETPSPPDFCALSRAVEAWRGMGFQVAIDDAGPALPHWQDMLDVPFTAVKLDGRLVADPDGYELTARIVEQAKRRNISVIAEGIEDQPTMARMRALGVDALQGFLMSRPLPAMAVPEWIAQWQAARHARAA